MAVKNVGTIYDNVDVANKPDTYFTLKLNSAVRTGKNVKYTFYAYATLASPGSYRCDSAGLQIKVNSSYAINDSTWKPSKSGGTRSATGWPVSGTYDVTVEQITGNPSLYVKFWDSQGSADYSKTWNSDTLYLPPAAPILQQVSVTTYSNKVIYNIKNTVDTEMSSVKLYNSSNQLITTLTPNTTSANVEITGLNYNTTISGYYVIATSNTLDSEKLYLTNATTNDIPKFSFRNSNNNIQILWPTSANANLVSKLTYNIKTKDNSGTSIATGTLYYSTVSSSTVENGNYVYTIRSLTSADWDKFANAYTGSYSGNFYVAYNVTVDGTERINPDSTDSRHYCAATLPTSYAPTFTSSNVVTAKETLSNLVGSNKFLSDNSNVIFSGINKVLIKGNSNNVATAKPSETTATITSYILSASGKIATVTDWVNTGGYLENITTNSINVKAMDSRGYGTTVTKTISKIFPYSKPIFSSMPMANRVGGVGTTITVTIKTKHYIYKQDTNGKNGVKKPNQLIIQYKMNNYGPTSWTNIATISSYSTNDSELKETTTIGTLSGVNIPISNTAIITFRLVDTMQTDLDSDPNRRFDPPTYSVNIGTGNVMLWRDMQHHWLGIGKKPTCALDVNGNATINGSINSLQELDLTSLSNSTFYPVGFKCGHDLLDCFIQSPGYSASAAYNQNLIHFQFTGSGWSDTPIQFSVLQYGCYSNDEITIGCIGRPTSYADKASVIIWLRGGFNYRLKCNYAPILYSEGYTDPNSTDSSKVVVTTGNNYYGGTNTNLSILFTPQSTITNGSYLSDLKLSTGQVITTGNLHLTLSYLLGSIIYPVNSIYMTTNGSFNPNGTFPGVWTKLDNDAYLKIVGSGAGSTGGQSDHKIGITHLPSHTHAGNAKTGWFEMRKSTGDANEIQTVDGTVFSSTASGTKSTTITNNSKEYKRQRINFSLTPSVQNTGDGNAYYPKYYGVYVWHRDS